MVCILTPLTRWPAPWIDKIKLKTEACLVWARLLRPGHEGGDVSPTQVYRSSVLWIRFFQSWHNILCSPRDSEVYAVMYGKAPGLSMTNILCRVNLYVQIRLEVVVWISPSFFSQWRQGSGDECTYSVTSQPNVISYLHYHSCPVWFIEVKESTLVDLIPTGQLNFIIQFEHGSYWGFGCSKMNFPTRGSDLESENFGVVWVRTVTLLKSWTLKHDVQHALITLCSAWSSFNRIASCVCVLHVYVHVRTSDSDAQDDKKCFYFSVENASLDFMSGDTTILEQDPVKGVFTSRKTDLLCFVTEPEEKRRIIGDTFMEVAKKVSLYPETVA